MYYEIKKASSILRERGVLSLLAKVVVYILWFLLSPFCLFSLSRFNRKGDFKKAVGFAYGNCLGLIAPKQVKSEITELLEIVARLRPKVVLEIGTGNGGSLFLFSKAASRDALIISVDLPGGRFGGGYSWWRKMLYRFLVLPSQKLYLLRSDSHKKETLAKIKILLGKRKVDFLFIDGDHSYQGVKKDFKMYRGLVRKGGIIAFHDIVPHSPETGCEVDRFWKEVKQKYSYKEIIQDQKQGWAGIGLIKIR